MYCVCRKSDGKIAGWARWGTVPFDEPTEIGFEIDHEPDLETEIWDGATGLRPKTAQEALDFETARLDDLALAIMQSAFGKAVGKALRDLEKRMRAAGQESEHADMAAAVTDADINRVYKSWVRDNL